MKTLATSSALALLAAPAFAAIDGPLVSAADLQAELGQGEVQLLDIRAEGEDGYGGGHIEGAVNAPYGLFRGPSDNPGQLVPAEELTATFQRLGLEQDKPVVVTYQGASETDFGAAARVYWTLKSSGFEEIAILNGGINAWDAEGFALSTEAVSPEASDITVSWDDSWTASVEDVQTAIDGGSDTLLLDARPESFWNGQQSHPAAAKPGTLPQSQYFVHSSWFSGGPAIIDAAAARSLAEENDLSSAENLISFCNTGHWAATNWFALSELAGIDNVKLYPESMVGWSNAGYDMANVPGPLSTLWNQIKDVF
ncbi:sulfurtransferase [Roseivivax sp. GX 12232]|uniref:sulfurtransferase n=1 Tax=Roseivivax sp. GX 12232 TaxID=2900547 RepID=UPI001E36BA87|nr:rhodanese-like domain-containing protein [Roseivivax sp. GX 12232]MCE0505102.1 sulfurtransferase [Roseivivax sp. GX 12232]